MDLAHEVLQADLLLRKLEAWCHCPWGWRAGHRSHCRPITTSLQLVCKEGADNQLFPCPLGGEMKLEVAFPGG